MKRKILYIVPHRLNRSPGQRFRCEHFIPILTQSAYEIKYANLLSEWDDKQFYKKRNYIYKTFIVFKTFIKRYIHTMNAKRYDLIYIYREAFMLGTTYFEKKLHKTNVPIIFDFDDAIWLNDTSEANKELDWLKRTSKTADICKMSSLVIVGNSYLAKYAKQYNNNVALIPTTIDTNYHKPKTNNNNEKVCIGWTGSSTTVKHFSTIVPTLKKLKEIYKTKIEFCIISDNIPIEMDLPINFIKWDKDKEIEQLQRFDIGIMPLPDNEWSKGKCGFKGLQYMALEIPTIMSPVGVNKEIINEGENGFLANSEKEWIDKLTLLIVNKDLRESLGKQGRKTIEGKFSINSNKQNYVQLFNELTKN